MFFTTNGAAGKIFAAIFFYREGYTYFFTVTFLPLILFLIERQPVNAQSRLTLCDPVDCSPRQSPLSVEFSRQ